LGYVDGHWPTYPDLETRFPAAYLIGLTVTGSTYNADGIDVEPGNPDAASGVTWVRDKLAHTPGSRPVIYASTIGTPGYGMPDILAELSVQGIPRASVRLLSAHYTTAAHICGPGTCGLISEPMDGTQWTDKHPGNAGSLIDMSVILDSFFVKHPDPPGDIMQIPGIPGDWLAGSVTTWTTADGRTHVIGADPNNTALWIVTQASAGPWSGTRKIT
jgi:hypothetical protein